MTYGITFIGLKRHTYYWDMVVILKFIVVMLAVCVTQTTIVELRQILIISLLLLFISLLCFMEPYIDQRLQSADMSSQLI